MSHKYDHGRIEKKWQKRWREKKIWGAHEDSSFPKFYILDMFPYPSAEGLHVGHPEGYTASDIVARYRRMKGYNVLHPMGWDAFGLPAENYAIKTGIQPKISMAKNIKNMRRQIESLGFSYDWSREINTTDPKYYKWTQWIFLQLFKKGLAYEATVPINWCPKDKTGLANEEVVGGKCERCGTPVVKKDMRQWMLRITKYADRLLKGLDGLDWPEPIKLLQRNWIGRSEGALIRFSVITTPSGVEGEAISSDTGATGEIATSPRQAGVPRNDASSVIKVFTTRADTLFGATYLVLAPEHPLVNHITTQEQKMAVEKYIQQAKAKSDLDRTDLAKDKTGVFTGAYAINPVNNKKIPIWVADYVLISYGTGAIMAVPAHDERDFAFAKKYRLPIEPVVIPSQQTRIVEETGSHIKTTTFAIGSINDAGGPQRNLKYLLEEAKLPYEGYGYLINSGEFTDIFSDEAGQKITNWLEKKGLGKKSVNYKLRDWVFSRQRYWGEPIPLVHCEECKKRDKKTILLVHGTGGHGRADWLAWLADELRALGHEVIAPDLPEPDEPILGKWLAALEQYKDKLNENAIVIGHSLGGPAVLHLVSGLNKKISKLILVAPIHKDIDWVEFARKHPDDPVAFQKKFNEAEISYDKVQQHTEKIIYFYSDKDYYIPAPVPQTYEKLLQADFHKLAGRDHFSINHGNAHTFPELLGEIVGENIMPLGVIPVPEEKLPVKLPEVEKYEPTGTGESPLASIEKWVNVKCPVCKKPAKRETNTMPQWAGSCWYYLRYLDPDNKEALVSKEKEKYWLQPNGVDLYVGGAEHAVLHLMYARFWHMFLFDIGVVSTPEPFMKLKNQGIILGEDNQKMSKSRGNVINPDVVVEEFGADSLRLYEMFMGPFESVKPWSTQGIRGVYRFLQRVWLLRDKVKEAPVIEEYERMRHRLIKKITEDIETFNFNTAVSTFMEASNAMADMAAVPQPLFESFLILLSPFAPHLAEELWEAIGHQESIALEKWPVYVAKMTQEDTVEFIVQVNGKLRDRIKASRSSTEEQVKELALASEKVKKYVTGKPKKVIFVKNRLINFVI